MKNGRCRLHGGKSTGPKDKKKQPKTFKTHGIYDLAMTEEERAFAASMVLGNVDEELKITRLRLRRALIAQDKWANAPLDEAGMPLIEVVKESSSERGDSIKKIQRVPNFDAIIHGLIAHINSLEKTRKELLKESDENDPSSPGDARDHVSFSGGLDGDGDDALPSPFTSET